MFMKRIIIILLIFLISQTSFKTNEVSCEFSVLIPFSYNQKALYLNTFLVLVNTNHYLDESYIPPNLDKVSNYEIPYINRAGETIYLDKTCLINLNQMILDMHELNLNVYLFSGYRSFDKQIKIYNSTLNKLEVALPGKSEHQTALAVDLSTLEHGLSTNFSQTAEFMWLINNSYKYGFILRYPKDKTLITGYSFEPWHFRYVGHHANEIKNEITLEEYIDNMKAY